MYNSAGSTVIIALREHTYVIGAISFAFCIRNRLKKIEKSLKLQRLQVRISVEYHTKAFFFWRPLFQLPVFYCWATFSPNLSRECKSSVIIQPSRFNGKEKIDSRTVVMSATIVKNIVGCVGRNRYCKSAKCACMQKSVRVKSYL